MRIDSSILLALLVNDPLDGLLLFLQRRYHILLFGLLTFQRTFLTLTTSQQFVFCIASTSQFAALGSNFSLFHFHIFTLRTLIGGIFPHESQASVHLRETAGTKDKHHLALNRSIAVHIAHRLDIALFTQFQILLQGIELPVHCLYFHINIGEIATYGVDGATLRGNLGIDDHQILQTLFHIALVATQSLFLQFDLSLNILSLILQTLHRLWLARCLTFCRSISCSLPGRCCFARRSFFALGTCGCSSCLRLCGAFLLCRHYHKGKGKKSEYNNSLHSLY